MKTTLLKKTVKKSAFSKETIIISLGGSLIVPEEIDTQFLAQFKALIESHLATKRFILITGGGKVCRKYQAAAKSLSMGAQYDIDALGISVTRVNGELMRIIFGQNAEKMIVTNPTTRVVFKKPVLVAAGWKPGCSTDYDAVLLAKKLKIKKLINLSNIDYVYDKDPKKFSDAKKIEQISWNEFRKIVGNKWDPGLNAPFDPIASKEAEQLGMTVAIMNGKNLENLNNYLHGKKFVGTIIQ